MHFTSNKIYVKVIENLILNLEKKLTKQQISQIFHLVTAALKSEVK